MFKMNLIYGTFENIPKPTFEQNQYDIELDNEVSVLCDISDIFQECRFVNLKVAGFGNNDWLCSCGLDLPCVLESLPDIITKISKNSYNFELDFFEQGTERTIFFKEQYNSVLLTCISRTDWKPNPNNIVMKKEEIKNIFVRFRNDFIYCAEKICSDLLYNEFLEEWLNTVKVEIN